MNWTEFLQDQGASEDWQDFGDLAAELASARSGTVIVPLTDMGVISARGEETLSFLHNMLTNDIKGLKRDHACLAGFCNPKGRLLATLLLWPGEEEGMHLALSADLVATVHKKLSMYVMRSKLQLSDASQQFLLVGLSGPKASLALGALGGEATTAQKLGRFPGGCSIPLGGDRYLLALAAETAQEAWRQLATIAKPAGLAAWHWLEIVSGNPRVSAATMEAFVPQMINFDQLGGLSFSKGCYPGQEVVARSQNLGKIKRHMYRVRLDGAENAENHLAPGAEIFSSGAEDQPCGSVVQAAPSPLGGEEALAVLQSSCFEAGDIHLGSRLGPALRFLPLPYDNLPAKG